MSAKPVMRMIKIVTFPMIRKMVRFDSEQARTVMAPIRRKTPTTCNVFIRLYPIISRIFETMGASDQADDADGLYKRYQVGETLVAESRRISAMKV